MSRLIVSHPSAPPEFGGRARRAPIRRIATTLLLMVMTLAGATLARAADTRWWTTSTSADYEGAESRGLLVDPDGVISVGPDAQVFEVDSLEVAWCIARTEDFVVIGGDGGRIVRWTGSGRAEPWVDLPVGQVLSIESDGDGFVAGTGPEGLVYRISAGGDTTRLAATGEKYVWALASDSRGGWYAATGIRGRIVHIDRDGRVEVRLDTEETNVVCLAPDGGGGVYGGGDTHGRVVHLDADGTARTLFDAPEDEIRAVAAGGHGAVFAAALPSQAVQNAGGEGEDEPRPARRSPSRKGAHVYRIVPDSAVVVWWTAPVPMIFDLVPLEGGVIAATGGRAGIFHLNAPGRATRWLSSTDAVFTAIDESDPQQLLAATTHPVRLWRVRPESRRAGTLTSPVLDAKRYARFGTLRWSGEANGGRVSFETRSGNTETPDTTWTPWRAARGEVVATPARFLQWRLDLSGADARVEAVEVAWRETNTPPFVTALRVAPPAAGFRSGELSVRSEPVTQELEGGRKVEFSLKRRPEGGERLDLPLWVQGLRVIQWNAEDPNEDPLRYRIDGRAAGASQWFPIAEDLVDSVFVWDTNLLTDGRYRLRVTASDAEGNAVGEARTGFAVSPSIAVDHTPPVIGAFTAEAGALRITVRGSASDEAGLLARLEVAVDDGSWRPLAPQGGLTDDASATFAATIENVTPGIHAVSLRVVDRSGNFAQRTVRVTVARAP